MSQRIAIALVLTCWLSVSSFAAEPHAVAAATNALQKPESSFVDPDTGMVLIRTPDGAIDGKSGAYLPRVPGGYLDRKTGRIIQCKDSECAPLR